MNALARKFGVSLVGGDTIQSPCLVINVAVLGEVKKKGSGAAFGC
jgi:thiamine monophosphate kinase